MKQILNLMATIPLLLIMLVSAASAAPFVYVTNEGEDTEGNVTIIDAATNEVVGTVTVGYTPVGVTVNPSGTKLYVANQQSYSVSVIDTASNTVESRIMMGSGNLPRGVVVSPDGQTVYVCSEDSNTLRAINSANEVIGTVGFSGSPRSVVISPDGSKVYVAIEDGTISVIDTASFIQTDTIGTEVFPLGMAISPDGDELYVTHIEAGTISVVDIASKTVVATVAAGSRPDDVVISPDGKKVYIVNSISDGTVTVFDTASRQVEGTFTVGSYPEDVAVTADGNRLYVVQRGGVAAIDAHTGSAVATLDMASASYGIAVGPGSVGGIPAQLKINDFSLYQSDVIGNLTRWEMVFTNPITQKQFVRTSRENLFDGLEFTDEEVYYDVTYRVWDADGNSDEKTKERFLVIAGIHPRGFTANVTEGAAPLTVRFTSDNPEEPLYSNWAFGDAMAGGSNEVSPTYTFANAGTYGIFHTAIYDSMEGASHITEYAPDYINVTGVKVLKPEANFTANVTSGNAPLAVQFTDTSTNSPDMRYWTFGDGITSREANPTHVYNKTGNYNVTLLVGNIGGRASVTVVNCITVRDAPIQKPKANFTANVTSGNAPLAVQFTDTSTNSPTVRVWTFGDGKTSNEMNPMHTYAKAGTYTVTLVVGNSAGKDIKTVKKFITVRNAPIQKPKANFTANVTSGNAPLAVQFTDMSTNNPTVRAWIFGDGSTSNEINPTHVYRKAGTYTVALVVGNSAGKDIKTVKKCITVKSTTPNNRGGYSRFMR